MEIRVVRQPLSSAAVEALALSDNTEMKAGSGWSRAVEQAAGRDYARECRSSAVTLRQGDAFVTSAGSLPDRAVLHGITIDYRPKPPSLATPQIVYQACRAALQQAEIFGIGSIATYLWCCRPGTAIAPPSEVAIAFVRAISDHARLTRYTTQVLLCEDDDRRYGLAAETVQAVTRPMSAS